MRIIRDSLSLALFGSGFLGTQILANDKWLWSIAPSHAYGLMGFVAIDIALSVALLLRVRLATGAAAVMAVVQLGSMLADAAVGQPEGVPSLAFRSYLLNDTSYVWLLVIQGVIIIVAIGAMAIPFLHQHGRRAEFLRIRRR